MNAASKSTKAITLTVVALALLILGAAVGTAVVVMAQGAPATILGCVRGNGNLRVIDPATQECRSNETALEWNI